MYAVGIAGMGVSILECEVCQYYRKLHFIRTHVAFETTGTLYAGMSGPISGSKVENEHFHAKNQHRKVARFAPKWVAWFAPESLARFTPK